MKEKANVKSVIITIIEFVLLVVVTRFVFTHVVMPVSVEGSSMKPTVYDKDIGLVNVFDSSNQEYERFDVVVIKMDGRDDYLIKRVIGLPGDHIEYVNDCLYINGVLTDEYFLDETHMEERKRDHHSVVFTNNFSYQLSDDEYFCIGDNRLDSSDSRHYGPFNHHEIIGKDIVVLFPFNHMKWIG